MLEGCKTAKERWGGVSEIIDRWLNGRQELIVLYCSVNGVGELNNDKRPLAIKLRELCQVLVDYVSAGHFEVYEQLNQEGLEHSDGSIEEAQPLYAQIESNTHLCLEFNDNCEIMSNIRSLQDQLSTLGETLEERFMLEDKLIKILHESHRDASH